MSANEMEILGRAGVLSALEHTPKLERHCSGVNACLRVFTGCDSSKCVLRTERLYEQTHLNPAPDDYP